MEPVVKERHEVLRTLTPATCDSRRERECILHDGSPRPEPQADCFGGDQKLSLWVWCVRAHNYSTWGITADYCHLSQVGGARCQAAPPLNHRLPQGALYTRTHQDTRVVKVKIIYCTSGHRVLLVCMGVCVCMNECVRATSPSPCPSGASPFSSLLSPGGHPTTVQSHFALVTSLRSKLGRTRKGSPACVHTCDMPRSLL